MSSPVVPNALTDKNTEDNEDNLNKSFDDKLRNTEITPENLNEKSPSNNETPSKNLDEISPQNLNDVKVEIGLQQGGGTTKPTAPVKENNVAPPESGNDNNDDDDEDDRLDLNIAEEGKFLDDKSTKIDIKADDDEGDDTATLPLNKKKDKEDPEKRNLPIHLFPILRLRLAWNRSSNVLEFFFKAIAIVFSTLGWFCCVGGIPFMSIAMLIIGSIYIGHCNIQQKIPVYLVVSGTLGTIQHFIAIWTKYIPKDSQGRLKVYRAYCQVVDRTISLFSMIWFVLGCIWVYSVHSKVEFTDDYKDEYCDSTVYYFAFWTLNLSFILMAALIVIALCVILFTVFQPKDSETSKV